MRPNKSVFAALCLWAHLVPATAQTHLSDREERGSALMQGCDTSLHVDINASLIAPYTYSFSSDVTPGSTMVQDQVWHCYNGTFYEQPGDYCEVTFPGQAEYPVCLTVNAFDLVASMPCSTSVCKFIEALPDISCEDLVADFTISGINGQTITLASNSVMNGAPLQVLWSYPDDATSATPDSTHTYEGPGPHKVCMTVVGPPPVYCTSTVCKWLYLGPGNVPCNLLLDQGFVLLQEGDVVGVLDTSITSGMAGNVSWDFGDGSTSTGPLAIHRYTGPGTYPVCGTVELWGPLVSDTCISTECTVVETTALVTVPEQSDKGELQVWPVPFQDRLTVQLPWADPVELRLLDLQGRTVDSWSFGVRTTHELDLGRLPAGCYLLECVAGKRTLRRTVVKE